MPLLELEALRLAVHCPERVAGRLHLALFSSELARAAYAELASAETLHGAIENAGPQVADLLSQLVVVDSQLEPDDVVRRLVEEATARALAELRREARSASPSMSHQELTDRSRALQLGLQSLRSVEMGPGYEISLEEAEERLVELLLGSPSIRRAQQP